MDEQQTRELIEDYTNFLIRIGALRPMFDKTYLVASYVNQ